MSATFKNLLLLITAVLALMGGYWIAQSMRPAEQVTTTLTYGGGELIDFTLPDVEGKKRSLHEWRGKVIVLNFWATWCPPCREEIPLFISLQKKHPADDLQVIGVAIDTLTAVMVYRQSVRINYPILIGENDAMPLRGPVRQPHGLPALYRDHRPQRLDCGSQTRCVQSNRA